MKKINLLLLLVLLFQFSVWAQSGTGYSNAVRLIDSGNTADAMERLRPYLSYRDYGKLSMYARYHFARAAYTNGQYQLAQATLEQLLDEYEWEKEDEAHYLLVLSYFGQNQAFSGLSEISKIREESLQQEAFKASYDFLSKNATVSFMVAHWNAFKGNEGYVRALEEKLKAQTVLTSSEKQILNELKGITNGNGAKASMDRIVNNTLDVAIVLPFNYQGGSGVRNIKGNNFVFELYQGIDLALKDAKKNGVDINVMTFDTERKDEVVRKILTDPFFHRADIIIGPVYPEETELVSAFAERNQIPFINPVSNIAENFDGRDYAYLFRPSTKVVVNHLLEYARRHVTGKKVALAYSGSTKDELLAKEYAEEASRMGYQIVYNQKVASNNIRRFLSDVGIRSGQSTSKVDQVIIFSDDPYIASPTLALLESMSTTTPIFVMDSWLFFNFANFELLEGNDLHYIGNNTINMAKSEVDDFRFRFFEKYNSYPGDYAYMGYDLMTWVSNTINNRNGFDFRANLNQRGQVDGNLSFGLNFRNSQCNLYVPFLKLNQGKLQEIK